jgi:hypothetical protein
MSAELIQGLDCSVPSKIFSDELKSIPTATLDIAGVREYLPDCLLNLRTIFGINDPAGFVLLDIPGEFCIIIINDRKPTPEIFDCSRSER